MSVNTTLSVTSKGNVSGNPSVNDYSGTWDPALIAQLEEHATSPYEREELDSLTSISPESIEAQISANLPAPTPPKSATSPELSKKNASAIVEYMRENKKDTITFDELTNLSQDPNATAEEKAAADYFTQNPAQYFLIETRDDLREDGRSSIDNFQQVADGNFSIASTDEMNSQLAAATLATFMVTHTPNIETTDTLSSINEGDLKNLAADPSNPNTEAAAQYFLAHPEVYKDIETTDDPRPDGTASVPELQEYVSKE
ncbi:hypothetical protein AWB78_07733 [Caballeronia calidae]|uniref:Uncharacterized protein n=1 Tax=Caballeronia calidae TaxID=1777139 RepID=A0A158EGA2_9BURK|nr:hypothetical protein [Caballeronia calidae]SAL05844.1 hypothetical protein AWB78_07733 [Caballeronia calidae]